MTSGSKKGTQIYFSFLPKVPGNETPSRFPSRALKERDTRLQGILYISQRPQKIRPIRRPPRKKRSSMFQKSGAFTEADAHFRALVKLLALELFF